MKINGRPIGLLVEPRLQPAEPRAFHLALALAGTHGVERDERSGWFLDRCTWPGIRHSSGR